MRPRFQGEVAGWSSSALTTRQSGLPTSTAKCLGVLSFRDRTVSFRDYVMPLNHDDDRPALHVTRTYKDEASLQK